MSAVASGTDGDIKLSVTLSDKELTQSARKLRMEIKSIFDNAAGKEVSETFQKLQDRMARVSGESRKVAKEMDALRNKKIPTEQYANLEKELGRLNSAADKVNARIAKFQAMGVDKKSSAFKSAQYDAVQLSDKLYKVRQQMDALRAGGKAFTLGSTTSEYAKLQEKQGSLSNTMTMLINKAHSLQNAEEEAGKSGQRAGINVASAFKWVPALLDKAARAAKRLASQLIGLTVKGFSRALTAFAHPIRTLVKGFDDSTRAAKGFHNVLSLKKLLAYGLGIRSLYMLFRKLRGAIKEGLQNMAQFNDGNNAVNRSISSLVSSLAYLKNSWATAFAPIVNFVMPVLTRVIDAVAKAAQVIGAFFAMLTGKNTILKAKKYYVDYADSVSKSNDSTAKSTKKATKEVKKWKNEMYGFDELNQQQEKDKDTGGGDTGSGAGGGGGGISPNDMFEEVPVSSLLPQSVQDWIKRLKEAWANGDWEGVGLIIAEGLNAAMKVADNWINTKFRPWGVKWAGRIAKILNGVVKGLDWELLGKTLADGINAVFDIANTFLKTFDFKALGSGIGRAIKSLFDNVDWALIGETFANKWNALFHIIEGIVTTPGIWTSLGSSLGTLFKSLFQNIDINSLATSAIAILNGIAEAIKAFLEKKPFDGLAKKLTDAINRVLHEVNWEELGKQIGDLVLTLLQFVLDFLKGVDWEQVGRAIGEFLAGVDWFSVFATLAQIIWEAIKACIQIVIGMLKGMGPEMIIAALSAVVAAISLFILGSQFLVPLVTSLATALGTVLAGIVTAIGAWPFAIAAVIAIAIAAIALWLKNGGAQVVKGFFEGIAEVMKTAAGWIKTNFIDPIITAVKNLLGIKSPSTVFAEIGGYLVEGLLKGISDTWHTITDFFTSALTLLTDTLSTAWETIKTNATTIWTNLKTSVSGIVTSLKTAVNNTFKTLKTNLSTTMNNIKTKLTNVSNNIKTSVSNKFKSLKTSLTTTVNSLATTVQSRWESLCTSITSRWSSITSYVRERWSSLKSTMSSVDFSSVGSNMVSGLLSGLQNAWSSVTSWATSAANSLASTMRSALQIHSPSKVFAKIGKEVPAGLVEGMRSGETRVTKQVKKSAKNLAKSSAKGVAAATKGIKKSNTSSLTKKSATKSNNALLTTISSNVSKILSAVKPAKKGKKGTDFTTSGNGAIIDIDSTKLADNVLNTMVMINQIGALAYKVNDNIAQMSAIAQGFVVPPNATKGFSDGSTDNTQYTGTLVSAIETALANVEANRGGQSSKNQVIKININGREVFNAVVRENNKALMRTGSSPLLA